MPPEARPPGIRHPASILRGSATGPFLTLKVEDAELLGDGTFVSCLKGFTQRVRNHCKAAGVFFEYDVRVEFDSGGRPHAHALLRTSASGYLLTPLVPEASSAWRLGE